MIHNDSAHWNVCPVCKKPRGRGKVHTRCSEVLKAQSAGGSPRPRPANKSHYTKSKVLGYFSKI